MRGVSATGRPEKSVPNDLDAGPINSVIEHVDDSPLHGTAATQGYPQGTNEILRHGHDGRSNEVTRRRRSREQSGLERTEGDLAVRLGATALGERGKSTLRDHDVGVGNGDGRLGISVRHPNRDETTLRQTQGDGAFFAAREHDAELSRAHEVALTRA
ncbi:MAG: hypothetical protein QM784_29940 [Polyangiaceae bacterium]